MSLQITLTDVKLTSTRRTRHTKSRGRGGLVLFSRFYFIVKLELENDVLVGLKKKIHKKEREREPWCNNRDKLSRIYLDS